MRGTADSYEWHRDTNAVTGLLFVMLEGSGGRLQFRSPELGLELSIEPRPGVLAVFDGREVLHTVEALGTNISERVTVPMNYYVAGDPQIRPEGLREHVYGPQDRGAEQSGDSPLR